MTEVLLLLVKISVGALILAIGMGATVADLAYVWRRPGLLLRSLLAMYVLVPLAALFLVKTWPLAPGVKAALLVLAVSAGAPLLPRKLQRFGSDAYVFSLVVTSSLLAIVVVPAWIALLALVFRRLDGGVGGRHSDGNWEGVSPPAGALHAAQGRGSDTERAFRRPRAGMAISATTTSGRSFRAASMSSLPLPTVPTSSK
jgi:Sodium Bile acid symporter family